MGGNNVIKTLIVALTMAALAFVVGSMAAEGRLQSSMLPLMGVIGVFTLLYLGKNCWWLVFIVPALSSFLPIPSIGGLPLAQLVAAAVFVYWILMWIMGYVDMKWRGVIWVDVPVMMFFCYFAYTYVMHPVSISMFADEQAEFVGGKDYIFMLLGLVTYCAISLIPCSISQLCTITKWTIILSFCLTVFNTAKGSANMGASGIAEGAAGGRFGLFSSFGIITAKLLAAWNSPLSLILSPKKICLLAVALFCLAMGGWREQLLTMGCFMLICAVSYRQLLVWIVLGVMAYGVLFYLSSQDVLLEAPYGVQRVLTTIPGLKLKKNIVDDAGHSSEWRKEMWRWALDPRMGYIHDYTWGDGFGISKTTMRLNTININRGRLRFGEQSYFAETGTWHSGFILSIHRIGYVGLGLLFVWTFASIILLIRLGTSLRGSKVMGYALYLTADYFAILVLFFVSAGTYSGFFKNVVALALAKIMYVEAMKEGLIAPMFSRKTYVPLMMQEEELARLRQARQVVQVMEHR